jgi:hypothetical protein
VDCEGQPRVVVLADVSFVSEVELEYSQQKEEEGEGGGKQRSKSARVSQWQFSGCISSSSSFSTETDGGTEEGVEWKVNKIMSHGGAFYE